VVSLELYRSTLEAVHLQIRAALGSWGIVRAAAQTPGLRDRISGTLQSGYAAETILNSCTETALLAAARLWDNEAEPPLCGTVANPLRNPELGNAIARLLHAAGVSEADARNRIKAFGKCASRQRRRARRAYASLEPLRNRWLAHRQVSTPKDGGPHYHDEGGADFPTIDFLSLIYRAHVIASGAEQLLEPRFFAEPFRTLRSEFIENGSAFWSAYVKAPPAKDDLDRVL
jgi:hypothetical protein